MKQALSVKTTGAIQLREITSQVQQAVQELGLREGICTVYCPHTTAGLIVNENADPDVASDLERAFEAAVPRVRFDHAEGNSHSHFLSSITGSSVQLLVDGGRLRLGRWQGVFFCEFDGPRQRTVWVRGMAG